MVSQVNGSFVAKDKSMAAYLKQVMRLLPSFERFELVHIRLCENSRPNALSKLENSKDSELLTIVHIEHLPRPSISKNKDPHRPHHCVSTKPHSVL